jgi:hypothetical protein
LPRAGELPLRHVHDAGAVLYLHSLH